MANLDIKDITKLLQEQEDNFFDNLYALLEGEQPKTTLAKIFDSALSQEQEALRILHEAAKIANDKQAEMVDLMAAQLALKIAPGIRKRNQRICTKIEKKFPEFVQRRM